VPGKWHNRASALLMEVFMFEGLASPLHLIVILIIALLLFGPSKLAGLGKGLGEGIRNFRDAMKEGSSSSGEAGKTDAANVAPTDPAEKKS